MTSVRVFGYLMVAVMGLFAVQGVAHAQATRTWVSGVGDDANPCSRTAPCKTFAGAISKTAANGEISVLDPGGFGALSITKSITIVGRNAEAGVLAAGTNGIIINAAATDKVVLRGLTIIGAGSGFSGIKFNSGGSLIVEDTQIEGFNAGATSYGIWFNPGGTSRLVVKDSTINNNGVPAGGAGIYVSPGATGQAMVSIENTSIAGNTNGVRANGRTFVTLRGSSVTGSTSSGVVAIGSSTEFSSMTVRDTLISNNGVLNASSAGVYASGDLAVIRLANNVVTNNAYGLRAVFGADIMSFGGNVVDDNANNGAPTVTVPTN